MNHRIFTLLCFFFCFSCGNEQAPPAAAASLSPQQHFLDYLSATFRQRPPDSTHFYLLLSKTVCRKCSNQLDSNFRSFQEELRPERITLITDYDWKDSLIEPKHYGLFLRDSLALFRQYDFPQSYITLYETSGGKVKAYYYLTGPKSFRYALSRLYPGWKE